MRPFWSDDYGPWLANLSSWLHNTKGFTSELKWQSFKSPWQPLVDVTMVMKVFTSEPALVQETALLCLSGQKKFLVSLNSPWWCWFDIWRLRDHSGLTLDEVGNPALRDVDCNVFAFLIKHWDILVCFNTMARMETGVSLICWLNCICFWWISQICHFKKQWWE